MDGHATCPRHRLPAFAHAPAELILEESIRTILATVDMDQVLERIGALLRRYFGSTRVALRRVLEAPRGYGEVLLVDDPDERDAPGGPAAPRGTRFAIDGTLFGATLARREPVVLEQLDAGAPRFPEERELAARGFGSVASFPLVVEQRVLGALEIAHGPREGLLTQCFQHGERIARLVALALSNSQMVDEVRRLNALLARENVALRVEIARDRLGRRYVAESAAMRAVLEKVRLVARSEATVLIRGETGTGKEGLARTLHENSPRFAGPFVVVDLGALPEGLVESELFGHEKGAFTGAGERKAGKFEIAAGGTLFLDEIGDASPAVQVRLLRALQEREVTRVGGTEPVPVDVRVVAATHRPLERMVEEERFRADLYYRIAAFPVELPPLAARREDIAPLARHFVARHAARMNRRPPAIPPEALARLAANAWPGNVRELENVLERAVILSRGETLELPDLGPAGPVPAAGGDAPPASWADAARATLERALAAAGGKIYGPDGAAARLGLPPSTLQGKLRKYRVR